VWESPFSVVGDGGCRGSLCALFDARSSAGTACKIGMDESVVCPPVDCREDIERPKVSAWSSAAGGEEPLH